MPPRPGRKVITSMSRVNRAATTERTSAAGHLSTLDDLRRAVTRATIEHIETHPDWLDHAVVVGTDGRVRSLVEVARGRVRRLLYGDAPERSSGLRVRRDLVNLTAVLMTAGRSR